MQATPEKLVRDLRVVVQDAEVLIKATAGDIEEKTREARAKLAGALVVAKESLSQAEQAAAQSVRAADAIVRARPYQTLATAFLLGLVIGVMAVRK